jgi:hypothetical protein
MKEHCPTCEGDVCAVSGPATPSIADAYRTALERLLDPEGLGHLVDGEARRYIKRVLDEHRIKPTPGYP